MAGKTPSSQQVAQQRARKKVNRARSRFLQQHDHHDHRPPRQRDCRVVFWRTRF